MWVARCLGSTVRCFAYPVLTVVHHTGSPEPLDIAQLAAEAGVRIYPVGIGSIEGAVLNIEGFNILTQLNETTLQDIARLTNGSYFQAEDSESLQKIYDNIDLQLAIKGEKIEVTSIVAAISILFLITGGLLSLIFLLYHSLLDIF